MITVPHAVMGLAYCANATHSLLSAPRKWQSVCLLGHEIQGKLYIFLGSTELCSVLMHMFVRKWLSVSVASSVYPVWPVPSLDIFQA